VADAALQEVQAKVRALHEVEVKKVVDCEVNEARASESTRVGSVSLPSPVLGDVDIEMEGEEDAEGEEVYGMHQDEETLLALCVFRSCDVDISLT
jgi:hypothetical protein